MLKKLSTLLALFCLCLSLSIASAAASGTDITVKIDGKTIVFPDAKPFINENSRTLCPLRFITEELSAEVEWQKASQTVKILKDTDTILLKIGETKALVNGKEVLFDTKAIVKNNRTYVPLRFVSEVFGERVDWDGKSKTVRILKTVSGKSDFYDPSTLSDEEKKISANLSEYFDAASKYKNFSGTVLIAKNGKVLFEKGYGLADSSQKIKITPKTTFAIGSVTKQFTAMAIMQLEEKGLLRVDDKLSKYFPDFPRGDDITIHHLLTHTSGIYNFTDLEDTVSEKLESISIDDIIDVLKTLKLEFEPGEKWDYSNSGYLLLGYIVEKVSGISFGEYLEQNIFDPLQMNDTGVCYIGDEKMYQSTGHVGFKELTPVDDEFLLKIAHGAGNMYSTIEDLYRWDRALYTEKLVKKETLEKIFAPHAKTPALGADYGYGWLVAEKDGVKVVTHTGGTIGFASEILRNLSKDITVIALSNNAQTDYGSINTAIDGILSGKKVDLPKEIKIIQVDPKLYDSYTGEFELVKGFTLTITKEKDKLFLQATGQPKLELSPLSETKYTLTVVDAAITFIKDSKGKVQELVLHQNGQELKGKRIK
ncbi:MAG: serine hydrolase [Clostridia bacterium]|nr:serine hydrolase [Clostridia bacterium]